MFGARYVQYPVLVQDVLCPGQVGRRYYLDGGRHAHFIWDEYADIRNQHQNDSAEHSDGLAVTFSGGGGQFARCHQHGR